MCLCTMLSIVDPMQMSQLCMCSIKVVYVSDWAMSSMLMMRSAQTSGMSPLLPALMLTCLPLLPLHPQ